MNELTVKEFAHQERVTERTVWNWIAKGAVQIRRTPGGGIRIHDQRRESRVVIAGLINTESQGKPSA